MVPGYIPTLVYTYHGTGLHTHPGYTSHTRVITTLGYTSHTRVSNTLKCGTYSPGYPEVWYIQPGLYTGWHIHRVIPPRVGYTQVYTSQGGLFLLRPAPKVGYSLSDLLLRWVYSLFYTPRVGL